MDKAAIISFIAVQATAIIVAARLFWRLKGPSIKKTREWIKNNPDKIAELLEHDDE